MKKFKNLIEYLPLLEDDNFGTWIIDRENDGSPEHPIQMPFVNYSEMVHHFIKDVYDFEEKNKDFELTRYGEILKKNGLEWGSKSMSEADVSMIPQNYVTLTDENAIKFLNRTLDLLDDDDDVQNVYHNWDE